ncbi:MAG: hypothetical protein ACRC2R_16310 [Xenococcaceae cyanobacterium]
MVYGLLPMVDRDRHSSKISAIEFIFERSLILKRVEIKLDRED